MARKRLFRNNNNMKSNTLSLRRRRQRRGGRRRRGGAGMHFTEVIAVSVPIAGKLYIKLSHLKNMPSDCMFRIQFVTFIGIQAYTPTKANNYQPGFESPSAMTVTVYDTNIREVATSGPRMLGPSPRTIRVHTPRSVEWFDKDMKGKDTTIASLQAACVGSPTDGATFVRGMIHVNVKLSPMFGFSACPALMLNNLQQYFDENHVSDENSGQHEAPLSISSQFEDVNICST